VREKRKEAAASRGVGDIATTSSPPPTILWLAKFGQEKSVNRFGVFSGFVFLLEIQPRGGQSSDSWNHGPYLPLVQTSDRGR
jgi:hypothetical protein